MESVKKYLDKKLRLKVNPKNSKVVRTARPRFPGFNVYKREGEGLVRITSRSKERFMGWSTPGASRIWSNREASLAHVQNTRDKQSPE